MKKLVKNQLSQAPLVLRSAATAQSSSGTQGIDGIEKQQWPERTCAQYRRTAVRLYFIESATSRQNSQLKSHINRRRIQRYALVSADY